MNEDFNCPHCRRLRELAAQEPPRVTRRPDPAPVPAIRNREIHPLSVVDVALNDPEIL